MLKRNDLVKQFELVVKQEIKNHQDAFNSTQISLNQFDKRLDAIHKDFQREIASLDSRLVDYGIEKANAEESFKKNLNKLNQHCLERIEVFEDPLKDLEDMCCDMANRKANAIELIALEEAMTKLRETTCKALDDIRSYIAQSLNHADRKRISELEQVRDQLLAKPSHTEELKTCFMKRLDEEKVNADGVMQELIALKRHSFIQDKKLENLYTLNERLKKQLEAR